MQFAFRKAALRGDDFVHVITAVSGRPPKRTLFLRSGFKDGRSDYSLTPTVFRKSGKSGFPIAEFVPDRAFEHEVAQRGISRAFCGGRIFFGRAGSDGGRNAELRNDLRCKVKPGTFSRACGVVNSEFFTLA